MLNMLNINGQNHKKTKNATRMWAKVMAALPNIGGALCSMPQSLADAHC